MTERLDIEVDEDLLNGFLDEASDFLSEIDALLVQLEDDPTNSEIINGIFRPIHSIKGNAPFFGFTKLRTLAHEMETLLAQLRDGSMQADGALISVLLEGTDELREMIGRSQHREPEVADSAHFDALVEKVVGAQGGSSTNPTKAWKALFEQARRLSADLESRDPGLHSGFELMLGILRELSPDEFQGDDDLGLPGGITLVRETLSHALNDPQNTNLHSKLKASIQSLKADYDAAEAIAIVDKLLEDVPPYLDTIGCDDLLSDLICSPLEKLLEFEVASAGKSKEPKGEAANTSAQREDSSEIANKSSGGGKADSSKSMRVSEEHVDEFLSYVGELFIFGEMLAYLERRVVSNEACKDIAFEFSRLTESFRVQSQNLQKSLMSIRKVPVKGLLQKVPRLVRDIATSTGKEISVTTEGQDVEVDKSLVELIDSPLTHMVRNAADHGIEPPEEREASGKARLGNIVVSVSEDEKFIVLKVQDDGAGLNYDAIQKKAESLGLTEPGRALTDAQVVDFLFQAGVSTAKQVTDVSGRGVGMDVVKRTIEAAGGNISVSSRAGQGTNFQVSLPKSVTTNIVESLVFMVNGRYYALPIDRVAEVFLREQGTVFSAAGPDRFINRHNEILPIVPACNILSIPGENLETYVGNCVIAVRAAGRKMALFVDEVISVQQLVMKSLQTIEVKDVYAGGALIGDGQIALVLELDKFCAGYDEQRVAERSHVASSVRENIPEEENFLGEGERRLETFLLAQIGNKSQVAIPLSEVNRLEKLKTKDIEFAGGNPVVQYRDSIMPLLALDLDTWDSRTAREDYSVVVAKRGEQHIGILVSQILDIVEENVLIESVGDEDRRISGTAVVQDRITDILSLDGILSHYGL